MSKLKEHSCVVYDRLREIVPVERFEDLSGDDLLKNTKTAFEVIGYSPKNLENSMEKSLKIQGENPQNSEVSLFEFVYLVWRVDNDLLH